MSAAVAERPTSVVEQILEGLGLSPVDGVAHCPVCDRDCLAFGPEAVTCTKGCQPSRLTATLGALGRTAATVSLSVMVDEWIKKVAAARTAAKTVCLADVDPREVSWLWPGRLPAGMLAVLDGPPGLGKSAMVTDLVARVTSGRPWPGSVGTQPPRAVVLLGHEDSPEHTIRPRLDAAGADVNRVHMITEVAGRFPTLPNDVEEIERVLRGAGACLLIVDPVSAYIGTADLHRDNEVRAALSPLVAVAERTGAAVLMLRHLRKTSGGGALNAGLGSIAITALARATLMLLKDPDDELGEARIVAWPKLSVGPQPASLRWRFESTGVGRPPRIAWDAVTSSLTADDILDRQDGRHREPSALDTACEWLREVLANGPLASAELEERARARGIAERTLKRARERVGVLREKRGKTWFASLPSARGPRAHGGRDGSLGLLGTVQPIQEGQERQEGQELPVEGDGLLEENLP